jgi:hypothetical protein
VRQVLAPATLKALKLRGYFCASPRRVVNGPVLSDVNDSCEARRLARLAALGLPVAALFIALLSITVQGQSTGSIEGQANDQHGAVVPAVVITAVSRETSLTRTAVTDDDGRYQIAALPVGSYRLEIELTDSRPRSSRV